MRKSLLSVAATIFLASAGLAFAQGDGAPSEPSWNANDGRLMTDHYTTMKYTTYRDTTMHPAVGTILPDSIKLYGLPDTMKSPHADRYQYGMINDHPVVVESSTRKVVHTWD